MSYHLDFTEQAIKGIEFHKKAGNKALLKKLNLLLIELSEHPRTGTGQIELLKHYSEETFSRRINREHRLIYRIREETVQVFVISTFGHYI